MPAAGTLIRLGLKLGQSLISALTGDTENFKKLLWGFVALLLLPLFAVMVLPILFSFMPAASEEQLILFSAAAQEVSAATETQDDPGIKIPWTEVAAVWTALYDQNFSGATPEKIRELAWNWAERREKEVTRTDEDGNTYSETVVWYTLRGLFEVEELLSLTGEQKEAAARYMVSLEEGGLSPPAGWEPKASYGWVWPLPGYEGISSPYGFRIHPITQRPQVHRGVDIPAPIGTPVLAASAGLVMEIGANQTLGNYVGIQGGGFETRYGHLSVVLVREGQKVEAGQEIGRVGNTGLSTGPHLHFEVRFAGENRNPLEYF